MPRLPEDSPGLLLWHVTLAWQRRVARALVEFDLTHTQFVVLAVVWALNVRGERPSQSAAATAAGGLDVRMTSQVVRALERKGLLTRDVDSSDTRARRLQLTEAGRRVAPAAVAAVETADDRFFASSERPLLLAVLRDLRRHSSAPEAAGEPGLFAE